MKRNHLVLDSLVGLSVGDALGAQFEGHRFELGRLGASFDSDSILLWTDDTQMALALVEVLLEAGEVQQDQLASAFGRRYQPLRGYGPSMHVVLPQLREGKNWRELQEAVFPGGSWGNGAAMRVAPLGAFLHDAPVGTVIAEAERSAEVTHAHPEARCGAAATALAARLAARSRDVPCPGSDPLFALVGAPLDATLRVARGLAEAQQLGPGASLEDAVAALGNGSKVSCPDTVPLALWIAFRHLDDFELAVRHALAAGGDTDTVAAIVGGVVASRVGLDGIPAAWRKRVEPVPTQLG